MLRLALRGMATHKGRLVSVSLAIIIGVAFMVGTTTLTSTINNVFDDLFADVNDGTDAFVRAEAAFDTGAFGGEQRGSIDGSLLDDVLATDGVAAADVAFENRNARIIQPDGDPIGNPGFGAPTFGGSWTEVDALNPWVLEPGGRAPEEPDEVVIDKRSAEEAGYEVGDTVVVETSQRLELELVGIARFGTTDSPGGASFALFTPERAAELLIEPGRADGIAVVADDGVSESELVAALDRVVPGGVEVLTGAEKTEEDQDAIQQGLSGFTTFLLVFVAIALVVGAFVIYNTFTIVLAQRLRELALLRALGARRGQVVRSVLLEALVVGFVASAIGAVVGIAVAAGLKGLFDALGFELPPGGLVVAPGSIVTAVVLGTVVTVLSSVLPAIRSSRVPPLAALRDVALESVPRTRPRLVTTLVALVLGAAALRVGFDDGTAGLIMVGILLVFVGILVGTSVIARPVTRVLGAPIARLRGVTGRLARENAMRNPRRTASTASALTIGVSLMTFFLVFNASLSASIDDVIDEQFFGDFVVDSGTFGFGGIPPAMTDELNQLEDVEGAASVRFVSAAVDGEDEFMSSVDPAIAFDLFDIDIQEGDPLALDDDGIAVYEGQAASEGWQLGDEVTVRFAETGDRTFTIEAIYGSQALAGPFVIGHDAYDANFPQSYDSQVYVQLADGTDPEAARPAIEAITDRFGTAELQDLGEFKRSQAEQFTPILALVSVLLSLSLIIAFIGVANTISLSVLERTREIGLTRAVGAVRRQIRAAISWESAIIAVFGSILGIAIGILLAWGVSTQLRDEGIATFVVPVGVVLVVLVVMALSGMLVAWRPARRAAKLDILTAVATE